MLGITIPRQEVHKTKTNPDNNKNEVLIWKTIKTLKTIIFWGKIKLGKTYKKLPYNFVFLLIQLILLNQIYEEVEGLE